MAANQFKPLGKRLRSYFRAYGGWAAVLGSPLFLTSLVVSAIDYDLWLKRTWIELGFSLIPSLLGFSLGTYAILFSLITTKMKKALRATKNSNGISALEEINATFFHFIIVQVLALLFALIYSGSLMADLAAWLGASWAAPLAIIAVSGSFLGLLLLVYSGLLVLGAALAVYRLARIVDPTEG